MGRTQEDRAKAIFEIIIDVPEERRAKKLDDLCHGAEDLKGMVEALLESHESAAAGGFLATPAVERPTTPDEPPSVGEKPGDMIGPYKLLQVIGEGGFGVVFMAEQKEPVKRRVALKIIKHGMDTKEVVARFEAERQALAMMDHPNIARVLDGGATQLGRPYFVMDLVKGVKITEYCDEAKLGVKERLALFGDVCRAIQHAHQKGVIHRDLKPSNVLVTLHDGKPVPIVIDFGIAKATNTELTSKTLFTEYGRMIGTPAYMSPEQAEMSGLDIDTRCDVYSLGVMLYELLTGSTPLDVQKLREEGFVKLLEAIRDAEPQRPSTRVSTAMTAPTIAAQRQLNPGKLGALLRGDLDWIVMRCLEKDRSRRYDSAAALAADVERHLAGEAVEAVPPSRAYRMRKFVRRHKGPVAAALLVGISLVLGIIGTTVGMTRAVHEADRAEREMARANEVKSVITAMLLGITPEEAQGADTTLLKGIVDDTAKRLDEGEVTDPLIAAELHLVIGSTYRAIAEHDLAKKHLDRAIAIYERERGRASREAAGASMELGILHQQQGALKKALEIHEDVLARFRALEGVERRTLIAEETNLAVTLWQMGEPERAFEILARVRKEALDAFGPEDQLTMQVMENQAVVLRALHRHDESLALLAQLVDVQSRVHGPNDLDTLTTKSNYAVVLSDAGRRRDAERVINDVQGRIVEILGPEHPRALAVLMGRARIHLSAGRTDEAEKLLDHAREVAARTLDPEHQLNLGLHRVLGEVYMQQARHEKAAEEILKGVAFSRNTLGERDPRALGNTTDAGEQLMKIGRYEDAHTLNLHAASSYAELYGRNNKKAVIARARLAASMSHVGDPKEAETLAREVIAQIEAQADPHLPMLRYVQGSLMRALAAQGRQDEAAILMERVTSRLKNEDANAAGFLQRMAKLRIEWGQLPAAEELTRRAYEAQAARDGVDAGYTLALLRELADLVRAQGRHEEALKLLRRCVEDARKTMGPDAAMTIENMARLGLVLGAVSKLEEAEHVLLDAIERADRVLGREHVVTAMCYRYLGMVYMDGSRLEDARRVLEIAVEVQQAATGEPDPADLNRLGTLAAIRTEYLAAEPLFAQAVTLGEKNFGPTDDRTLDYANRHADCLFRLGRKTDAATRYERTLEVTAGVLPDTHPRRLAAAEALLKIRRAQDRPAAQIPLLELQLEAAGGIREEAPPQVLQIASLLGSNYLSVGRYEEAEAIFDRARALATPKTPPHAFLRTMDMARLQSLGRWDEAETAAAEAHAVFVGVVGPKAPIVLLLDVARAEIALNGGAREEAVAAAEANFERVAESLPREHEVRRYAAYVLIEALHRAGRPKEAIPVIEELVGVLGSLAKNEDAQRDTLDRLAACLLRIASTKTYDPDRALKLATRAVHEEERHAGGQLWLRKFTLAKAKLHASSRREVAQQTVETAVQLAPPPYRKVLIDLWAAETTAFEQR